MEKDMMPVLFNDSFQNFRSKQIPHAQLILTDVPYVLGKNAYASNPAWYLDGDNKKSEIELWQTQERIPTMQEMECKGTTYAVTNRKF